MRIELFGHTELQVRSSILKEHSDFFFKFLDSPEKNQSEDSEWQYDWVSEVEDDGEWHLVAKQNMQSSLVDNVLSEENADLQPLAFCFMINAIDALARRISEEPEHFIELAYTFRNKTLFRECAFHNAGDIEASQPEPYGLILYDGHFPWDVDEIDDSDVSLPSPSKKRRLE
ncbi:uncharacterized protein Bfra_009113 [Botrytis fragariae]|uniref:BTB domain-containing protein n=1 Tax=Botrytis fragariae TaxID=1964551 RepID=A0A8H6EH38_9HELO|nr:uncharacterized protein Bfra_009113 [Botrytis fragariae]KAF5872084.1 hypothetical protein Bfra_009113 [Botrytis fragariae]